MQSIMSHQFSQIPKADIPRSVFNRSHGHKTTFDEGYLIPFYVDEALPGDTFKLKANLFARLATPIVPIMDNMFMETFYFAVPNRLIWENWVKMMGERKSPNDTIDYTVPQITPYNSGSGFAENSLADHFGLPVSITGLSVSALWFRAYNLIYNEWFRDQNLQDALVVDIDDTTKTDQHYQIVRRGKRHDYFTSALPWPQKGPGVEIPLGVQAPVYGDGKSLGLTDGSYSFPMMDYKLTGGNIPVDLLMGHDTQLGSNVGTSTTPVTGSDVAKSNTVGVVQTGESGLIADLTSVGAIAVNALRLAIQLQRLQERDARGGTRYTEMIRSHFGVISPDFRLQRPEYLGGSSFRININPVQQTSSTLTAQGTPQGNLAAFGLASDSSGGFTKSFTEHCVIIGLVNVRADLTYQQGINRMFSRKTRYDYYWPVLANLGEQGILQKEIYATGLTDQDQAIFGYQERWAEYRYYPSQITGKLRSTAGQSLDVWHLSQDFLTSPTLGHEFIEERPPVSRVVAVQNQPHFIFDSYIDLQCARPMPVYSVPGMMDHF